MADKDSKSPATTSFGYDTMLPVWVKVQTVLDGTEAMRSAGLAYLPQHEAEADEAYAERLSRNTLFNLTKITLNSWVGRPFSDPLTFTEVPPKVEAVLDDVDLLGNNVHVFARNWFSDGLAKAYSHVLIDFPRVQQGETPRTMADDLREGLRPYWIHIRPEQLFFADAEIVDGRERLREVRIMEQVNERVGFAEVLMPQIRRIFMDEQFTPAVGTVELYRLRESKKKTDKEEWYKHDSYTFSLDRIPLVTYYADRSGFMAGTSPLEDLADINIAHWQSTSDQRAILTVARFPILALSGGTDEGKKVVIGPYRILYCADSQGRYYYVEHGGAAIEAGRQDLQDLEAQMSEYGAEFLKKRPGDVTATARALDAAESTSSLQDATLRFQDALNTALYYTALWFKLDNGGQVLISTDFGPEEVNAAELSTLQATRTAKDISRKAYLNELKRRALLPDDYDPDEDALQLEQEAMNMFGELEPEPKPPTGTEEGEGEEEE